MSNVYQIRAASGHAEIERMAGQLSGGGDGGDNGGMDTSPFATKADLSAQGYELREDISTLRTETRTGFADVRAEFADVRREMRTEFSDVRAEFASVRGEMRTGFAELRGDMHKMDAENKKWFLGTALTLVATVIAASGFLFTSLRDRPNPSAATSSPPIIINVPGAAPPAAK